MAVLRRLILVFAVAVAFAQVQCVSACAVESNGAQSAPPCHQHTGSQPASPDSCSFHLVISPATAPQTAHFGVPLVAIPNCAPIAPSLADAPHFAPAPAALPSAVEALSSIVLRI